MNGKGIRRVSRGRALIAMALAALFVALPVTNGLALAQDDIDSRIEFTRGELERAIDDWTKESLMGARASFERLLDRGGRDWLVRYYIALADYRIAIWHMSNNQRDGIREFLDEAEELLEESIDETPRFAESYSLLGAVLGLKIGMKPISGMWLGPRIGGIVAEATQLDAENPRTWMIEGIGAFYRPKMFGGGYDKAREAMLKSVAFFETYEPADPAYPVWGESEAHAWLGVMEMDKGELDSAARRFERALEINPQNGWVTYVLSPKLAELRQEARAD